MLQHCTVQLCCLWGMAQTSSACQQCIPGVKIASSISGRACCYLHCSFSESLFLPQVHSSARARHARLCNSCRVATLTMLRQLYRH